MRNRDPSVRRERWLSHPLCRRYAAVVFSTIARLSPQGDASESRTICWALGCLAKGESEILGVWSLDGLSAMPAVVFADLHNRGVEFLRCGLGDLGDFEAEFQRAFRGGAAYPAIEQVIAEALGAARPMDRPAVEQLLRARPDDPSGDPAAVFAAEISSEDLRRKYQAILQQWDEAVAGFQRLFALPEPYRQLASSLDRTAIRMQERLVRAIRRHGPFVDSADVFDYVVDWLLRADQRQMREAEAAHLARDAFGSQSSPLAQGLGAAVGTPTLA